jgi:hypothetical protein
MEQHHWEIGCNPSDFDDLLKGVSAVSTLWFLAGYLQGFSDSMGTRANGRQSKLHSNGGGLLLSSGLATIPWEGSPEGVASVREGL